MKIHTTHIDPSLAKGLATRLVRRIDEKQETTIPHHVRRDVTSLVQKVARGVPSKKRDKVAAQLLSILAKCEHVIGMAYTGEMAGVYMLEPMEDGAIEVKVAIMDFVKRSMQEHRVTNMYFGSKHVLERLFLRENIHQHTQLLSLYNLLMEAVAITGSIYNHQAIVDGQYTGSVSIPVSTGGMFLADAEVTSDGSYCLRINTYIDHDKVAEHNFEQALYVGEHCASYGFS